MRFDVPEPQIEAAYRDFQRHLHPDRFVSADEVERAHSDYWSSIASHCYSELKNPLRRARLVLNAQHPGTSELVSEEEATVSDPTLLLDIFEIDEKISALQSAEEATELHREILQRYSKELEALTQAFAKNDLKGAERALERCQMVHRVLQRANYWTPGSCS